MPGFKGRDSQLLGALGCLQSTANANANVRQVPVCMDYCTSYQDLLMHVIVKLILVCLVVDLKMNSKNASMPCDIQVPNDI